MSLVPSYQSYISYLNTCHPPPFIYPESLQIWIPWWHSTRTHIVKAQRWRISSQNTNQCWMLHFSWFSAAYLDPPFMVLTSKCSCGCCSQFCGRHSQICRSKNKVISNEIKLDSEIVDNADLWMKALLSILHILPVKINQGGTEWTGILIIS